VAENVDSKSAGGRPRLSVEILIAAEALIVAGLLTWSQLWIDTYHIYIGHGDSIWSVTISLSAIYFAVLASLGSMVCAVWSLCKGTGEAPYRFAIGLAGFSTSITFVVVCMSAVTTWWKALKGYTEFHPLVHITSAEHALGVTISLSVVGGLLLWLWIFCWGPVLARKLSNQNAGSKAVDTDQPTTVSESIRLTCQSCGEALPLDYRGPCPKCGNRKRKFVLMANETITLLESVWQTRTKIMKANPTIRWLTRGITACSILFAILVPLVFSGVVQQVVGSVLGVLFAILSHLLGPHALDRVKKTVFGRVEH
jgi:hypothetical protein